ncbi:MAG: DUF2190 family protein, partial [Phycisphaerales bacterium]|nr:DUF2190 family protein [Phycisphaerales bacterium]
MAKNGVKHFPESELVDFTNTSGSTITSGTPVLFGGRYGIAQTDVPNNGTGTLALAGRFEVTKATGAGTDYAAGTRGVLVSGS